MLSFIRLKIYIQNISFCFLVCDYGFRAVVIAAVQRKDKLIINNFSQVIVLLAVSVMMSTWIVLYDKY